MGVRVVVKKLAKPGRPLKAGGGTVCAVTPVYRFPLSSDEERSLESVRVHLVHCDRYLAVPATLEIPSDFLRGEKVIRFPLYYFTYPYGYNRLLLRRAFFEAFREYSYVLLYQLDCVLFRDGLHDWVAREYDYVGSPWFMDSEKKRTELPASVGNGGLSLRKISAALTLLRAPMRRGTLFPKPPGNVPQPSKVHWFVWNLRRRVRQHLGMWTVEDEIENFFENEDVFWSFIAPLIGPSWRIPDVSEALDFAIEENPQLCVKLNDGRAPFGCHAWTKFDRSFLESLLESRGETSGTSPTEASR